MSLSLSVLPEIISMFSFGTFNFLLKNLISSWFAFPFSGTAFILIF